MNELFEALSSAYIVGNPDPELRWVEAYPFWYYDSPEGHPDHWGDNYN